MPEPESGANHTSILVVDDPEVAGMLREFLERAGHRVLTAHTGRDGLAALRDASVTLPLVDLRLPDIDGLEVMKEALRLPGPPEVVILTGYATLESAVAAVEAGAAGAAIPRGSGRWRSRRG